MLQTMTTAELSSRTGVRESYLVDIESDREEPSSRALMQIAEALAGAGATYEGLSTLLRTPEAGPQAANGQPPGVQHELQPKFVIVGSRQILLDVARSNAKQAGSWFFWIAGLSVVNSLAGLFQAGYGMILGLGATQVVDAIATGLALETGSLAALMARLSALLFTTAAAAFFILLGVYARRLALWPYVVGMIVYGLDALIFLAAADWIGLGFHGFVLLMLWGGFVTTRAVVATGVESTTAGDSPSTPVA
jgi:transcriptional regulator with XRE-family HTH domain